MKYEYDIFNVENDIDIDLYISSLTSDFKLIKESTEEDDINYKLYYKKFGYPTFVIYTKLSANEYKFIELLDGYYLNSDIVKKAYKEYKDILSRPLTNSSYFVYVVIDVEHIDNSILNFVKYGSLANTYFKKNDHSRVPIILERKTNNIYISSIPKGKSSILNNWKYFEELKSFAIKKMRCIQYKRTTRIQKKILKYDLNWTMNNKIIHKYSFEKSNFLDFLIIILGILIALYLINRDPILWYRMFSIIVYSLLLIIAFILNCIKIKNSSQNKNYLAIKLEKEIELNDINKIVNDKKIRHELLSDDKLVLLLKKNIYITDNNRTFKTIDTDDMILLLNKKWIFIRNSNYTLVKFMVKQLKHYKLI